MSLLGFDAIGRWALGQLPSNGNAALAVSAGSFTETGKASPFGISIAESAGAFTFTGSAGSFAVQEWVAAGAFAYTGLPANVTAIESAGKDILVLTGVATVDLIAAATMPGGFAFDAISAPFSVSYAPSPATCTLTEVAAGYTRDFINWVWRTFPRSSWSDEAASAPSWSAANPQAPSWNNSAAPIPNWTAIATPAATWTPE